MNCPECGGDLEAGATPDIAPPVVGLQCDVCGYSISYQGDTEWTVHGDRWQQEGDGA